MTFYYYCPLKNNLPLCHALQFAHVKSIAIPRYNTRKMKVPCTLFTLLSQQSTVPHDVGAPNQSKNDHLAMLGPAQLCGHRLHFYPFIPPSTHYEVKLNFLNGCKGGKDSTYNFCLHFNDAKSLSPILAITRVLKIEEPFVYSHIMGQIDCL